jgi:DNA-binding transcriptional regulator YhcF (GntR family)
MTILNSFDNYLRLWSIVLMSLRIKSPAEQVAAHLEAEILSGRWQETMPGVIRLSSEMGVNRTTIQAGLRLLEARGLLQPGGEKKRRRIVLPTSHDMRRMLLDNGSARRLRVKILIFSKGDEISRDALHLVQHLHMTRHDPEFASRSLWSLGMDVRRVARFVGKNPADAWVVIAGSREILEWFAEQPTPCFALLGGFRGVNLAGAKPGKIPAQRKALQRLVALGHRRIVKVVMNDRIYPELGKAEQTFLDDLKSLGIPTSEYNLPAWGEHPAMFYKRLDSLFRHTPPTAVFLDAVSLFYAARDHLALQGIVAPRDVSLICDDPDSSFEWMEPSVAHIHWSFQPIARRVAQWLENIASGKDDRRQALLRAKFVDGGTIGPVAKS